jgi:hypothetical protein
LEWLATSASPNSEPISSATNRDSLGLGIVPTAFANDIVVRICLMNLRLLNVPLLLSLSRIGRAALFETPAGMTTRDTDAGDAPLTMSASCSPQEGRRRWEVASVLVVEQRRALLPRAIRVATGKLERERGPRDPTSG